MPSGELGSVLRRLRRAIGMQAAADSPDRELLERFVHQGDEDAFAALLRRHGPLVLSACRRMLSEPHDVEDAFQATFFIFVRKARGIARGEAVGSWLYRVAYHAAARVRARAAKQRAREMPLEASDVPAAAADADSGADLQPLLDDAVNRLPEKYRRPIVLCCLQGKSNEEAARELGCPVGTVGTRLSRARERLRAMLTRRGVAVPAAALSVALEPTLASAALPPELFRSTLQSGMLLAAGQTAGAFTPAVATVAGDVLRGMAMARVRSAVAALALLVVCTGAGWLTFRAVAQSAAAPLPGEACPDALVPADEARFSQAHRLLKPQPGESRWLEANWLTSVWEARRRAAAEGKPIFLVVAGKDSPLGPCSWNGRLFRIPSAWSPDRLRLINEHFVPVADVGDLLMKRQDAEGQFIRDDCRLKFITQAGYVVCLTAGGKVLGSDPVKAWEAFQQLPAAERAPGAVSVGDAGNVDAASEWPQPPANGLILKIYARPLGQEADGTLRHARGAEFMSENPRAEDMQIQLAASPDFLWLRQDEWQQLVPADPRVGVELPVPAPLARRLFCCHLVPARIYNMGGTWGAHQVRAGELRLRVEEVTKDTVRMRLEGAAHLGAAYDPALSLEQQELGYEAQLLGYVTYDRQRKVFARFDLTALGEVYGRMPVGAPATPMHGSVRPGRALLGFALELTAGDKPADRIPPTGRYHKDYFGHR